MSHSYTIPVIQTDRLTLREYRPADFDAFAGHLADPESAAHIALADRDTAWRIFSGHAGLWVLHGAGWWAVEMRQTGELIGNVGAFFRETSPVMEVGWNTYRAFWGHGYASEAAAAALDFAFEVRREPKIQALIDSGNESSLRVAQRLGFAYESETEIHGKTVGRYSRQRGR
ncbi:RimJ/RimL family protein N-acetyltransferase [Duganella sp. 1411]|uniref:GNAT family N-acetyltransferase n=1 Tax=Duganella sp. 1411 TaxID=2806572 RepID=UPI001AE1D0D0|nr:GNAT family N-acetyltransferase [Duganella sp. 1411]MBP1207093.1 RimJ/RimL family protein N-acetyltransferase [Duganella sp. 1411]